MLKTKENNFEDSGDTSVGNFFNVECAMLLHRMFESVSKNIWIWSIWNDSLYCKYRSYWHNDFTQSRLVYYYVVPLYLCKYLVPYFTAVKTTSKSWAVQV